MLKKGILAGFLGLSLFLTTLAAAPAHAATITISYYATSIAGDQAPPDYGLRLDGFFTGDANEEVTFAFDSVLFDVYDDGTARLHGTISVAEFDNTGGASPYASTWDLDVWFAAGSGGNPSYDYYVVDPTAGTEMANQADPSNDYANLWTYAGMQDFQVGVGANQKNSNFGAAGWVNFEHTTLSGTIGDRDVHWAASDFLMDLTVVPEPTTALLMGLGLIAMAGLRRRVN
jgi:hypothetical protein